MECVICGKAFDAEALLAGHFEHCFESHLPSSSTSSRSSTVAVFSPAAPEHPKGLGQLSVRVTGIVVQCLPFPDLLSLACAASHMLPESCFVDTIRQCWSTLKFPKGDALSNGCRCTFPDPIQVASRSARHCRRVGLQLWHVMNMTRMTVLIKVFSGKRVPLHLDGDSVEGNMVLLRPVRELYDSLENSEGFPPRDVVALSQNRRLHHFDVPLGVYLWPSVKGSGEVGHHVFSMDLIMSMAIGSCDSRR